MKAETEAHLEKAGLSLRKALASLEAASGLPEMAENAGRDAYYAAFHAAKALIFERIGKTLKTHKGVHSEFNKLAQHEPDLDRELRKFLVKSYSLKAAADYETGASLKISLAEAKQAIEQARRFVDTVIGAIGE